MVASSQDRAIILLIRFVGHGSIRWNGNLTVVGVNFSIDVVSSIVTADEFVLFVLASTKSIMSEDFTWTQVGRRQCLQNDGEEDEECCLSQVHFANDGDNAE